MTKLFTTLILTSLVLTGCGLDSQNNNSGRVTPMTKEEARERFPHLFKINYDQLNEFVPVNSSNIDTSDWGAYKNLEHGFKVEYPNEWTFQEGTGGTKVGEENLIKPVVHVSFGKPMPKAKEGSYIWSINFQRDVREIESIIKFTGRQFDDREEMRNYVYIDGQKHLLVTVTTEKYPDWISRSIYLIHDNKLFIISNGAIDDPRFYKFYSSIQF